MSNLETENKGIVYWVTGLSGSGKSTVSQLLFEKLRKEGERVVYLDGDILRNMMGNNQQYSSEERLTLSYRYGKFCKNFSDQGLVVVASFIALFHEVQKWNRENIYNYVEVLIDVPFEILLERDKKKLYSRAMAGEIENVVGFDVQPELPKKPDLVINNYGEFSAKESAEKILKYHHESFRTI